MSQDGKIRTIMGSFYKDINVQTIPSISQNDALSIALKNPPINSILKDSLCNYKLIILPIQDIYYLTYELHIAGIHDGESWCYFINASSGNIIDIQDDRCYSQANVYLTHPFLCDVSLVSPLNNINNDHYLRGTYANILHYEDDRAHNSSNDFTYSTSSTHFDEANLYYHVDKMACYFRNLGFEDVIQTTVYD